MDDIDKKVIELVRDECMANAPDVTPASRFIDLGIDEMNKVELAMAVEDEFDLSMPEAESDKLITVQQLIEYVKSKKSA